MYGSWDVERDRHNFLSFWTVFCRFTPIATRKIKIKKIKKNEKKMNKTPRDITIIYMCTIKWKSYDVWFRRYGVWQAKVFCHFGPFFALLPTSNPKNQNFEKMKKTSGDIIILHRCIINNNRMMYGSWAISCDRQKFSSFWLMFYPFSPLTIQKIKILKLNNAPGDIIILHISTINYNHMMHGSWDMERDRQILLLFWTVICPFDLSVP